MYNCARESVKRFSQQRERKSFKTYSIISKRSQKRHVRGRRLRERAKEREIENVYTSVFWPSFFLFFFFAFFFLLKNFTLVVVRVSSQKTASPFQKRNKRHFFYHKRERFKVDLNTRTKAQNTRTKHSSEQRERATRSTFWLFKESHAESAYIFFHE